MLALALALSVQSILQAPAAAAPAEWSQLPALPDRVGFAGMFAGVSGGSLIAAGGANFPHKPLAEGGAKVWHNSIFVLEDPQGPWRLVEDKLPRPLAYGASITCQDRVILLGGGDAQRHYADVWELQWARGKLTFTALPKLPRPCTGHAAALAGDALYVAGGLDEPEGRAAALKTFWALDLAKPAQERRWAELEPWPGVERHQAVAAVHEGAFYLFGGLRMKAKPGGGTERESPYLRDACRYRDGRWQKLTEAPRGLTAAPSPAVTTGGTILICGGLDSLERRPFPTAIAAYDISRDAWSQQGEMPAEAARVTAPAVLWRGHMAIVSGETAPGIRSPAVWQFQPQRGR